MGEVRKVAPARRLSDGMTTKSVLPSRPAGSVPIKNQAFTRAEKAPHHAPIKTCCAQTKRAITAACCHAFSGGEPPGSDYVGLGAQRRSREALQHSRLHAVGYPSLDGPCSVGATSVVTSIVHHSISCLIDEMHWGLSTHIYHSI